MPLAAPEECLPVWVEAAFPSECISDVGICFVKGGGIGFIMESIIGIDLFLAARNCFYNTKYLYWLYNSGSVLGFTASDNWFSKISKSIQVFKSTDIA